MSQYNLLVEQNTYLEAIEGKTIDTSNVTVVAQPALASGTDSVSAVQSGTWNVNSTVSNQISGFALESSLSALNGKVTAVDTGSVTVIAQPALASGTDSVSAVQSGTWNVNSTVQNQITGYATSQKQDDAKTVLDSIDTKLTGISPSLSSGVLLNKTTSSGVDETSSAIDAENYSKITIWGWEDTTSSASTLRFEISHDNSDWIPVQVVGNTYFASKGECFFMNINTEARYFRTVLSPQVSVATKLYYSMK